MTKDQRKDHQQRVINSLNSRLSDIDHKLSSDCNPSVEDMLNKQKSNILNRLAELYATEKYGLV